MCKKPQQIQVLPINLDFFAKECIIGALWMDKRHLSGCLFVPLVDFLLPFGLASSCRWSVTSNPLLHTVSFVDFIFEYFDLCEKYLGTFIAHLL